MDLKRTGRRVLRFLRFTKALMIEQLPEKAFAVFKATVDKALRLTSVLIPILVVLSMTIIIYMVGFKDVSQQQKPHYD